MIRLRPWYLGCLAVLGTITGCGGDCKAVQHDSGSTQEETTDIASTGGNCVVHVYKTNKLLDSVGPKP